MNVYRHSCTCTSACPNVTGHVPRVYFRLSFRVKRLIVEQADDSTIAAATLQDKLDEVRQPADDVVKKVQDNVTKLFKEHFDWLLPLWEKVQLLQPTRALVDKLWASLVNKLWASLVALLKFEKKTKPSTRTVSQFTLKRTAGWESHFTTWMQHEDVQEVAQTGKGHVAAHYLGCIVHHVDEVCLFSVVLVFPDCEKGGGTVIGYHKGLRRLHLHTTIPFDRVPRMVSYPFPRLSSPPPTRSFPLPLDRRSFTLFVTERMNANKIAPAYPSHVHLLSKERSEVLYYIQRLRA